MTDRMRAAGVLPDVRAYEAQGFRWVAMCGWSDWERIAKVSYNGGEQRFYKLDGTPTEWYWEAGVVWTRGGQ